MLMFSIQFSWDILYTHPVHIHKYISVTDETKLILVLFENFYFLQ